MSNLKKILLIALLLSFGMGTGFAQEVDLPAFTKLVVSPDINLILVKGEKESIRMDFSGIDEEKINYRVKGKKLQVFLDKARLLPKYKKERHGYSRNSYNIYKGAMVTAYVTYTDLTKLVIRGEEDAVCKSPIEAKKFRLKVYGESDVKLASVDAKKLKLNLKGENYVKISAGKVETQVYKSYGENEVKSKGLIAQKSKVKSYGEGRVSINSTDKVVVTSLGEVDVRYEGTAKLSKGIILGESDIIKK
ncbi:head GIN domain-containing protein [Flammeovirgaceae bacterium SG7u.111]|nr:head GIN domain-containing protein [Flammeovirgaceae bacterium SG7u.132]WPO37520.1 head GIN domain-containing protein [Flammeovirgaceae bacterium SG7u.111]